LKKNYTKTILILCLLLTSYSQSQTIWTGTTTTFTKANNADWTLPANQDQLTTNVALTRKNNMSIFNIAQETGAIQDCSFNPADTEWAYGTTANIGTLTFQGFMDTNGCTPTDIVGQDMVLHLITDNVYIDIKFTSWSAGGSGGGFSYERSTDQSLSVNDFETYNSIQLFPNPSTHYIQLSNLKNKENYSIYNILGTEINKGTISAHEQIDINELTNGLYFLKIENGSTFKFIKE